MAIDHTGIGVRDVALSAKFYDAALGALGLRRIAQVPKTGAADDIGYGADFPTFWIDRFHPHGQKYHMAFAARSRGEVDAFYKAAMGAGGSDNGTPGLRDTARLSARVLRGVRSRSRRQQHGSGLPRSLTAPRIV